MINQRLLNVIEKIKTGNFDYIEGVSLFSQLSSNRVLTRNLITRHTPSNEQKLIYELKKLAKHEKVKENTSSKITQHVVGTISSNDDEAESPKLETSLDHIRYSTDNFNNPNHSSSENELGIQEQLELQRKQLYRKRGHVHGKLHNCKSDSERYECALEIVNTQKKIDVLNQDLKLVRNGEIPSKYIKNNTSAEQFIELRNIKMYISRYEKKLAAAKSIEEQKKFESKLSEYKTKLQKLI